MADPDLDELDEALAAFDVPAERGRRSAREERIIAGFEEIQRFVAEHQRLPQHGDGVDIFERIYAARLDRIRASAECRAVLAAMDHQGLLGDESSIEQAEPEPDLDELADALEGFGAADIADLHHVRTTDERRAAEEIANREKCKDFAVFKPIFERVQDELKRGVRKARAFELKAEIRPGALFIVGGQKAYVAEMDEVFTNAQGRRDARLRVVFDNGTESNMLMRSLQRALHKDDAGRRISDPEIGPLFGNEAEDDDPSSGSIYVLKSMSTHPLVAQHRDVVHKIGVTGGGVEKRIANAAASPTFLMADVELVAVYKLVGIDRTKLEAIIHRVFASARLDIEVRDAMNQVSRPREWFLAPLFVIDAVVEKIRDGSITDYVYDPGSASLIRIPHPAKQ